jgi:response regulator RpfG family c-di-GMP phosphodiesterase
MKKILLVDDEVIIRKLARNTLRSQNYTILEAADGDEAIRIAQSEHPDLILLDIRMPGKSGFEVCRLLKSDAATRDIIVLMLTAEMLDEDMEEGMRSGAADFFTKPFSPLELMAKITSYLKEDEPAPSPPEGEHRRSAASTAQARSLRPPDELQTLEREQLLLYAIDLGQIWREEQARSSELKAAYEKLKSLEQMKDHFISLVSHELRTPLSVIKGYVQMMDEVLRSTDVSQELREFMGPIVQSSDRLQELIQELLDFSKMKSGLITFQKKEVNVPALLGLIAHDVVPLARDKQQEFRIEVKGDMRSIRADSERLREALLHLMRNAVNFTPPHGMVWVECEDEGLWVKIRVCDNGPGIAPEEIDKIFTPFFQSGNLLTRTHDGIGLGLAIAHHIVEDHGGTLNVESEYGKGSVFTVTLPRSYQDAKEMVAEFQARDPKRLEDLSRNLQVTEKQVLGYAQELSAKLAQERLRGRQLEETIEEMEQTYLETIAALAKAADVKDAYSLGHTDRVTHYARCIARVLNPNLLEQRDFKYSLLLHDLGKIGIAEELLKKAGRLTDDEWETLKSHTELSVQLISSVKFLAPALASVRSHHERWDGKGYPDGLAGEDIPLPARIIALADAFEAMTSDRPYRAGLSFEDARKEIETQAGRQFDPQVVKAFIDAWPQVTTPPTEVWPASGELGGAPPHAPDHHEHSHHH